MQKYPNKSYNFDAELKTKITMKKIYFYTHSPIRSRYFLNIFCIEYISSIRQMPSNISIISLKKTISRRFWWGKTIVYLPSVIRYTTHK